MLVTSCATADDRGARKTKTRAHAKRAVFADCLARILFGATDTTGSTLADEPSGGSQTGAAGGFRSLRGAQFVTIVRALPVTCRLRPSRAALRRYLAHACICANGKGMKTISVSTTATAVTVTWSDLGISSASQITGIWGNFINGASNVTSDLECKETRPLFGPRHNVVGTGCR